MSRPGTMAAGRRGQRKARASGCTFSLEVRAFLSFARHCAHGGDATSRDSRSSRPTALGRAVPAGEQHGTVLMARKLLDSRYVYDYGRALANTDLRARIGAIREAGVAEGARSAVRIAGKAEYIGPPFECSRRFAASVTVRAMRPPPASLLRS